MPDSRFYLTHEPLNAASAARLCGAVVSGAENGLIAHVAAADAADLAGAAVFVDDEKRLGALGGRDTALIFAPKNAAGAWSGPSPLALHPAPREAFARLAAHLHRERPLADDVGVDVSASIETAARLHRTAIVGPGAKIGARAVLGPHVVIGPGVEIGDDAEIGAGVSIVCALVGARAVVKPGARIGQAGFGFVPTKDGLVRMPQLGRVLIGDDVEIGANACVDRGALGDTVIEAGAKIDNLVQIGHNVRIGASSALAAHVGVSGSTVIGRGVMLGGKAGLADHLSIGDGARIAAAAGVMHDVPAGESWGGIPARPMRRWFRETATLARLAMRGKEKDGA